MATKEIKTKIAYDTSDAKKAMTELRTATKDLTSQMKLNDAEMKRDGQTSENLKKKQELLKRQIDAQKTAIDKLTKEYEKTVKAKGADSKEAKALETQLNKLKTTLANQQTELANTAKAADTLGASFKNAATVIGEKLKEACETAKDAITSLAAGLVALEKKTVDITIEAATHYDDAATNALMHGVSYEDYMATAYAAGTSDIDTEAYYNAFTKFKTRFTQEEDVGKLQEILGMNTAEFYNAYGEMIAGGNWLGVFENILASGGGLNEGQLNDLFGQSAAKNLQTVIGDNWEQFQANREAAFAVGYVLTPDQAASLGAFKDGLDALQNNISALNDGLGAMFSVPLTPLIEDAAGFAGEISKIIQDSFSADEIDVDAIQSSVAEWLPDVLGDASAFVRVLKVWVDLLNGALNGTWDAFTEDPEMQDALKEWEDAFGELWGDDENGLQGLGNNLYNNIIKPILDKVGEWIQGIGGELWDSIVGAMPKEVRGMLGLQTAGERAITAEYSANAGEIIPAYLDSVMSGAALSAIDRANIREEQVSNNTTNNDNNIKVVINANVADGFELGEKTAEGINKALTQFGVKTGRRVFGGGRGD